MFYFDVPFFTEHFVFFKYERTSPIGLNFFWDTVKLNEAFSIFCDFFCFDWVIDPNYGPFAEPMNSNKNVWFAGYNFFI